MVPRRPIAAASATPRLRHPLVVTVHGMLASGRSFRPIARALRCGPKGWRSSISTIARCGVRSSLTRPRCGTDCGIKSGVPRSIDCHLVTHSMGGIVARAALAMVCDDEASVQIDRDVWQEKTGRMLMLAPPNRGAQLASIPLGPFKSLFPQLAELSESPTSFVNQLPMPHGWPVHVVSATRDHVVGRGRTDLAMSHQRSSVETTHQRLVGHRTTVDLATQWLAGTSHDADHDAGLDAEPSRMMGRLAF